MAYLEANSLSPLLLQEQISMPGFALLFVYVINPKMGMRSLTWDYLHV